MPTEEKIDQKNYNFLKPANNSNGKSMWSVIALVVAIILVGFRFARSFDLLPKGGDTPNHFSAIGFELTDVQQLSELIDRMTPLAERIEVPQGAYFRFVDPSGAEFWIQKDGTGEVLGGNPYFQAKSRVTVDVDRIEHGILPSLDGYAAISVINPEDGEMFYPAILDLPDFAALPALTFPYRTEIAWTGFAQSIDVYQDQEDFAARGPKRMSAQAFIPSGLFSPDGGKKEPEALGIVHGVILETELKTNAFTGKQFYWMLVETYGGQIDMVADPAQLPTAPQVGNIVAGEFWLTGRIISPEI